MLFDWFKDYSVYCSFSLRVYFYDDSFWRVFYVVYKDFFNDEFYSVRFSIIF